MSLSLVKYTAQSCRATVSASDHATVSVDESLPRYSVKSEMRRVGNTWVTPRRLNSKEGF